MSKTIGKRAEYVALEIMEIGKPVTPSQIDAHTGTGTYSSKYISFLKRDGFVFEIKKDGRNVVSYTLLSRPADSKLPPGAFDRTRASKSVKVPAEKKAKTKKAKAKTGKVKVNDVTDTKTPGNFVLPAKKAVAAKKKAVIKDTTSSVTKKEDIDPFDDYAVLPDDTEVGEIISVMGD